MRPATVVAVVPFLLASVAPAQAGVVPAAPLNATEVAAFAAVRTWQQQLADGRIGVESSAAVRGYEQRYFGYDTDGRPGSAATCDFAPEWATLALLWPQRTALVATRPILATSLGHVFVGPEQPPGTTWNPDFASITGSGVEPHLGNMLLQSGVANDGTVWQRIDDAAGMGLRRQRARVRGLPESRVLGAEIEVGAPRFAWHPGWLPVGERDVVAFRAGLARPAAGAAEGAGGLVAEADGVAARDLQLSIRSCGGAAVLRPEDVAVVDGELVVTVPDGAFVRDDWLDDQAWAVEALRRLARHERAARATAAIDRDRDGRGEFGAVEDVVPQLELGSIRRLDNGRFLFRGHLFELHLPPGADAAEQGFVAYAWPARPDRPNALAFCVDERGAVRSCSARERFAGHDRAPAADAGADESLGWRSLR